MKKSCFLSFSSTFSVLQCYRYFIRAVILQYLGTLPRVFVLSSLSLSLYPLPTFILRSYLPRYSTPQTFPQLNAKIPTPTRPDMVLAYQQTKKSLHCTALFRIVTPHFPRRQLTSPVAPSFPAPQPRLLPAYSLSSNRGDPEATDRQSSTFVEPHKDTVKTDPGGLAA